VPIATPSLGGRGAKAEKLYEVKSTKYQVSAGKVVPCQKGIFG